LLSHGRYEEGAQMLLHRRASIADFGFTRPVSYRGFVLGKIALVLLAFAWVGLLVFLWLKPPHGILLNVLAWLALVLLVPDIRAILMSWNEFKQYNPSEDRSASAEKEGEGGPRP
jgi:hypothetical protein